jgi:hypothetical protein
MKTQSRFRCETAVLIVLALGCGLVWSQASTETDQSSLIKVSIAMKVTTVPPGQYPAAILKILNVSKSNNIGFTLREWNYHVHVIGAIGEPPKTEYYRHLVGDSRPGDGPFLGDHSIPQLQVPPGGSDHWGIGLSSYYDLSVPGKYSVYLEVRDDSGVWLRTNTVQFEIQPPAH